MDNENETRPLLHSFQSETWRSRARKRCMRVPSEITITGIILGLFLIVVTLLIVLENMESDKKQKNISLNDNLLASPMKFNKKQDPLWENKRDYYMKLKEKKVEEKNGKWDKVNKGWKELPDITASAAQFNEKEDPLWLYKRDYYMRLKEKRVEEKNRKWDKVNKGWKTIYDTPGNIQDHDYEEKQKRLDDDVETTLVGDNLDEYGKVVDDSLETFGNLRMSEPSEMMKFRQQVLEVKNLLHSNIDWKIIDDGWKALSEQGWREKDIRRALFMALNEKRQELRKAELENILQSPMNVDDIWDQINDSWKKNLYKGKEDVDNQKIKDTDEAGRHLTINDEWRKEMSILQSPKSDMKKFVKEDEGWQNLANQGWQNKDIEEELIKAWKERENVMQSPQAPLNTQNLWTKAADFLRGHFNKGMDKQKSQMETNDEWAKNFNILQSSYKKQKDNDGKKDKHSKDVWKDKTDDEQEEPQEFQMNFDDFSSIIQALKDRQKGMDNQKSQMEINDEFMTLLQSSYKKWKKNKEFKKKHPYEDWKHNTTEEIENNNDQLQQSPMNIEEFLDVIEAIREKERNTFFGRKDDHGTTLSPGDISLQKSMPFVHTKQAKMGNEWQNIPEQSLREKDLKEAVYKAWKDGDKLRKSALGQNNYKWKKVNNGWKTISNKS